ncbi:MAG: flagellar basal body-associated FliL family protein [Pseudomonadota bacterium]
MSDAAETEEVAPEQPKKKGSKVLLIALVAALLLGGGSFYGVYSGLIPLPFGNKEEMAEGKGMADHKMAEPLEAEGEPEKEMAFVAVEPILVSLAPGGPAAHLKLSLQLEVDPEKSADVTARLPRVADVLNTFLRAVEVGDLERPRSMLRLRAQMLRRVQLVVGPGAVYDLLIQEFVLN